MKFGLLCEMQLPRPLGSDHWHADDEHKMVQQTLEQIELADRLGFDYVFFVEHHFLEEYSISSAPEVMLAAGAQSPPKAASAGVGRGGETRDGDDRGAARHGRDWLWVRDARGGR